jgi:hypothetical protein
VIQLQVLLGEEGISLCLDRAQVANREPALQAIEAAGAVPRRSQR